MCAVNLPSDLENVRRKPLKPVPFPDTKMTRTVLNDGATEKGSKLPHMESLVPLNGYVELNPSSI